MTEFETARGNMIKGQIRPNNVTDARLLEIMGGVPRENFVPIHLKDVSYIDEDLDIGHGRYLEEPRVLARLLQAADIQPNDMVLDIGDGTGYAAAVMSYLASTVVMLEEDDKFVKRVTKVLVDLDICNVPVVQGSMKDGFPEQAPYDVILVHGAIEDVPENLLKQLGEDGRLITVIRSKNNKGEAVVIRREGGLYRKTSIFEAFVPMLSTFEQEERFVF